VLPEKVVLASNNRGKLRELNELLDGLGIHLRPQADFTVPDIAETGLSFVENAILKARNATLHTQLPAIADDSGIEVEFLGGAPGIYSARYAGAGASDAENLELLLKQVRESGLERPAARYQCVIVYLSHGADATPLIAHGTWHGQLLSEPKGSNGFGYDPMFFVPSHGCTSAELPPVEKNRISHRGQAMQDLLHILSSLKGKGY